MFAIKEDKSIHLTRGDVADIIVSAVTGDGEAYTFQPGDVVRFRVVQKADYCVIHLEKTQTVAESAAQVTISLDKEDSRFCDVINRPVDFWYEVELNPDTVPQTIVGYDEDGPKIFRLYPEGCDQC